MGMGSLVLSRRLKESLVVRDADGKTVVTITPIMWRNGKVRLCIQADRKYNIVRSELLAPKEPTAVEGASHEKAA